MVYACGFDGSLVTYKIYFAVDGFEAAAEIQSRVIMREAPSPEQPAGWWWMSAARTRRIVGNEGDLTSSLHALDRGIRRIEYPIRAIAITQLCSIDISRFAQVCPPSHRRFERQAASASRTFFGSITASMK